VSRRREVEEHLRTLGEVQGILGSMKTLALLETRKLARYLATQQRVLETIEAAAADFHSHYPVEPEAPAGPGHVLVVIGSERGLCGDFNDKLRQALDGDLQQHGDSQTLLVAVGHKLCAKLAVDRDIAATLDGPGVAEEVEAVLNDLLEALNRLQAEPGWQALTVLYHATEDAGVRVRELFPRFEETPTRPATGYPSLLNLAPEAFLAELLDHYLFAALHEMFYTSLTAENHQRMEHLQRALDRLEQQTAELGLKCNTLRQEEITEEIEVILLSAEALYQP
jgi:F-type H+-transporting ATPase subunit gamma